MVTQRAVFGVLLHAEVIVMRDGILSVDEVEYFYEHNGRGRRSKAEFLATI